MGWFIVKYRRSKQTTNYQVSAAHNTPLELAWSIIPLLIMIPIFYWGFTGYADKLAAPMDSEEIMVSGKQWNWSFTYRNGASPQSEDQHYLTQTRVDVPVFVVPLKRPVKLIMNSTDVIHAFYIPDYRTKMDVIPNRYTSMWFYPEQLTNEEDPETKQLKYPNKPKNPAHKVFCAEYCGQDHSEMAAIMKVVEPQEYEATIKKWLDYPGPISLLKVGQMAYTGKGCNSCHTVNGNNSTGPTWKGMFGTKHSYTNGETDKLVDENWLRENILYSQKRILNNFGNQMPVFAGQLSPLELDGLILYIKTLSDNAGAKSAGEQEGAVTVEQYRKRESDAAGKK
jgi:cytochrome c oxidase subunit 2